jgi:Family of unknown function (DUF5681)
MSDNMNGYQVGYRSPPQHTQFKKGQSGNPHGRRKQNHNIRSLLSDEMNRQLSFNENGKPAKDSKLSLMVKQAINKAVAGDFRPLAQLVKLQSWLQAIKDSENMRSIKDTTSVQEAIELYQEKIRASKEAAGLGKQSR